MPVQAITIKATLLWWFTLKSHSTGREHVVTNNSTTYLYCAGMLQVIETFSRREGWWYKGIKGDDGVKSKGTRFLIEREK